MSPLLQILLALINIVLVIIETLLGIRTILKLFGASVVSPVVGGIYKLTEPFLRPFIDVFPLTRVEGKYEIEFAAIFAFIVYALLGYVFSVVVIRNTHKPQLKS